MGYTHYFKLKPSTPEDMCTLRPDIVDAAKNLEKALQKEHKEKVVHVSSTKTYLNIDGPGENMVWPPSPNELGWVKTGREVYDQVVAALLIYIKHIYKEHVRVSSDGEWNDDWADARALYTRVFKTDPECPFDPPEDEEDKEDKPPSPKPTQDADDKPPSPKPTQDADESPKPTPSPTQAPPSPDYTHADKRHKAE